MARPTLTEQIAKAASEGNLEKVKELGEKLKAQTEKPKPKPKAKPKEKTENSPHISSAKNNRRTVKSDDGETRTVARAVPFKPIKRKNLFEDTLTESVADIKFDQSWQAKVGDVQKIKREKVKTIKIVCARCKEKKEVSSNEVLHENWTCNACLSNAKKRG